MTKQVINDAVMQYTKANKILYFLYFLKCVNDQLKKDNYKVDPDARELKIAGEPWYACLVNMWPKIADAYEMLCDGQIKNDRLIQIITQQCNEMIALKLNLGCKIRDRIIYGYHDVIGEDSKEFFKNIHPEGQFPGINISCIRHNFLKDAKIWQIKSCIDWLINEEYSCIKDKKNNVADINDEITLASEIVLTRKLYMAVYGGEVDNDKYGIAFFDFLFTRCMRTKNGYKSMCYLRKLQRLANKYNTNLKKSLTNK